MHTYEAFGCLLAVLGAWVFCGSTVNRLRSAYGRAPRGTRRGYDSFLWWMERRDAADRAARWQSLGLSLLAVGVLLALAARLAS
jgi:hypothetical protein